MGKKAKKVRIAAKSEGATVVGKNGKDTKTATEVEASFKKNLESQSKDGKAGGLCRDASLGCFASNTDGTTSFVNATIACNDYNNDFKDYCCSALSNLLSVDNSRDPNGHLCKYQSCIIFTFSFFL